MKWWITYLSLPVWYASYMVSTLQIVLKSPKVLGLFSMAENKRNFIMCLSLLPPSVSVKMPLWYSSICNRGFVGLVEHVLCHVYFQCHLEGIWNRISHRCSLLVKKKSNVRVGLWIKDPNTQHCVSQRVRRVGLLQHAPGQGDVSIRVKYFYIIQHFDVEQLSI